MSGVRTFVGLPLPEDLVEALSAARAAFTDVDHSWRDEKWVPRENLHVTVKFIGDVDEDALDALGDAVGETIAGRRAFDLASGRIRAVPNTRHASMLWCALADPTGSCADLASAVERACLPFGAKVDERSFNPHATLVRARRPHRAGEDALAVANDAVACLPDLVSVGRVTLFASELTRRSPIYSVLRTWELDRG